MLLLLFAAAAPGKERAALQADLDSLATTLDSMLGKFEKMQARAQAAVTDEEIAELTTFSTDDRTAQGTPVPPPKYLYHAAPAEYFESFRRSGFSRAAKQNGATAAAGRDSGRTESVLDRTSAHFFYNLSLIHI